ncbi:MAG: hypothetical protein IT343_10295 [Candidatus Melainabacteria bacterium]|nr:hypothetical protein [Candidatus Melainabacteria bacterium]
MQNGDSTMNPTTINTKDEVAESRNASERTQSAAGASQNATPVCKNGVCMVTWKPTKPQAA